MLLAKIPIILEQLSSGEFMSFLCTVLCKEAAGLELRQPNDFCLDLEVREELPFENRMKMIYKLVSLLVKLVQKMNLTGERINIFLTKKMCFDKFSEALPAIFAMLRQLGQTEKKLVIKTLRLIQELLNNGKLRDLFITKYLNKINNKF